MTDSDTNSASIREKDRSGWNRRQFLSGSGSGLLAASLPLSPSVTPSAVAVSPPVEPKPPIKIAQIGTGHAHAAGKMAVYRESADFDVVGLAEPDPSRRDTATAKAPYQGLPLLDVEALLGTPGLQAVAIETTVPELLTYAELAIRAGCHIHLDKPPGLSLPRYQRLYAEADENQRIIQLGYMYRYNPAIQFLERALADGWLGEVHTVDAAMGKVIPASARRALAKVPGGIMFELGCHVIDLAVGVLGEPERVHAYPREVRDDYGDGFADNMLAVFEHPKATATIRASAVEVEGFARRHFTVLGTAGSLHVQPLDRPTITLSLDQARGEYRKGTQSVPFDPPYRRYVGDAVDFAAAIRGERTFRWNSEVDLAVQRTVLLASGLSLD